MFNTRGFWLLTLGCAALGCGAEATAPSDALTLTQAQLTSAPDLIAIGSLDGNQADLSRATAAPLENGVPGNLFGGIGSGLAYAGGHTFIAVPDRGPNADAYNDAVDDTVSYISRFQTLKLKLKRAKAGADLPFSLDAQLKRTTLLYSHDALTYGTGEGLGVGDGAPALNRGNRFYFTGRSDNFDPTHTSTWPNNARFDPESVRVSNDGERIYISDEYGPYLYEFKRATGERTRVFTLPAEFAVSVLSPTKDVEIGDNQVGRLANKGMEGLAISPDGSMLFGSMQSPLLQDGGKAARFVRIVTVDLASGAVDQYAYALTNIGSETKPKYPTVSDIVAVNNHELLVDERDGKGLGDDSETAYKRVYHIDLASAADVSGLAGESELASYAVTKTLLLDVVQVLNAHGIASTEIPSKLEGLAFGPDVRVGNARMHTLFLANDNDFTGTVVDETHPDGVANPNAFFVFGIDPALLPGYVPQQFDEGCERDD